MDWNPFAFSAISRLASTGYNAITGDDQFLNTISNSMSVTKQFKPMIETINYDE